MEKFHELTRQILKHQVYWGPQQNIDSIIRKWLSEKSKAINADANAERTVDEILGLTDVWEKPCHLGCKSGECFHLNPKQKQSWCSHLTWAQGTDKDDPVCGVWYLNKTDDRHWTCIVSNDDWKQCPICLTPRPTPKPLVERVATVMWECSTKTTTFDNADQRVRGDWLKEAQAALDFLREHKEEL